LVLNNFESPVNQTSGNEKIDDLVQEMLDNHIIFEWIPYNKFDEIEEISKSSSIIIYSAIWEDGPLCFNNQYNEYTRNSNKEVTLRCLQNSENTIEVLINKV
jgi:hypothetical protein